MSRRKALFVTPYLMGAMALGVWAAIHLVRDGFALRWLAVGLVSWPIVGVVGWLMVFRPTARTSARLPVLTLLAVAGGGLAVYAYVLAGTGSVLTLGLAVGGLAGFLLYDYWYSTLDRPQTNALNVGFKLPEFTVQDADKTPISSEDFVGSPTLLMFYRGNWCPLCMAQIKEIAAGYRALTDRGVRIVLISPQPHGRTRSLAKKFAVPFEFLVDPQNAAARRLGIVAEGGLPMGMQMFGYDSDTVLPTVIITDASGLVVFADQTDNYRVRPEPGVFLQVLDKHLAGADHHATLVAQG